MFNLVNAKNLCPFKAALVCCPSWVFPVFAPVHMWGIPGSPPWQVVRQKKKPRSPSLLSSISYFPVMCCGAAHLWTLLNAALVWPDSSLLLHFPSNLPVQPSDCHRNAVKPFYSFCMAALFPQHCQYLCISSNSSFFHHPLLCLFINRLFPTAHRMSNPGFLGTRCNKFSLS